MISASQTMFIQTTRLTLELTRREHKAFNIKEQDDESKAIERPGRVLI